ncbi:chaperonin 10-like protein [Mycena sp. CBHHK59/15]|nr:chaperonin 10-like protein [Mycena sp. CBHHK59/15]
MKEVYVASDLGTKIIDSPIPTPGPDQIVVKVVVSGSNPKDWKVPQWGTPGNSGDDIAGIVHAVGENVYEFKVGGRVAAFHEALTPHGSFAEYALAWQYTTFHIPNHLSFEGAATLPVAAMTAAVGLFHQIGLDLPAPWTTQSAPLPLVVYGAATAVGAYAIQFARLANIHPIIGVAGRGIPFAESLIDKSKGDAIVDYRAGDDAVVQGVKDALAAAGQEGIAYAFDAVSEQGSIENILGALARPGRVTSVLPPERFARTQPFEYPEGVTGSFTSAGAVHIDAKEFGFVYFRYMARMIFEGRFKPHPHEVVPGGLAGVRQALQDLKAGKASAVKYVFRIGETEGVGHD